MTGEPARRWSRVMIAALTAVGLQACGEIEWPPEDPGWRARIRGEVTDVLGGPPAPFAVGSQRSEGVDASGVEVVFVERTDPDGTQAPAFLLRPPGHSEADRRAGVLVLHGHGPGARTLVEDPSRPERGIAGALARAGFVVLVPDLRSFGGYRPGGLDHLGYTEEIARSGDVYARLAAQDARAALDWLSTRPGVDPTRVGVIGHSLGGFIALLTALAEPEVRAIVTSGIFIPFDSHFSDDNHACQHLRALTAIGDSPELAAALPPTALQVHFGARDDEFAREYGGLDNAQRLLDRWAADPIEPAPEVTSSPDLGHALDPELHVEFLIRALGP